MPTRQVLPRSASRVGILLLNSHFQPVHYNAEAVSILGYPKKTRAATPSLDPVFSPSQLTSLTKPMVPVVLEFTSGRRRYVCRAFHLDGRTNLDGKVQPRLVMLLERESREQEADLSRISEQFQLTNRESETVQLLLKGLTSKEIAMEMCISPNTVKAFLKLAMAKVGASNRTALVARLFNRASLVVLTQFLFDAGFF
jgi:DNA-binding CsgD family transcriptional regulator